MPITASTLIEVKRIKGKGRGLFAREFIPEDTLIERVPVIVLPQADLYREDGTSAIWEYAFEWNTGEVAVALGFGSMYNHSYTPNAHYQDAGPRQKEFLAWRDIEKGEEITINYNGDPNDQTKMWFDVK